jgi:hypothetical protein
MKKYEFNGKWNSTIELEFFTQLNSDKFYRYETRISHKRLLESGRVPLSITDERTINPDPEEEQINAINFILNNEEKIYQEVFKNLKEIIIPDAKKNFDLDNEDKATVEYWFPKLQSIADMNKTLGIGGIGVDIEYRNGIAWTSYMFDFSAEEEHGLIMTFEGDKFLDFGAIGDYTHEKIMTKEEFRKYVEKLNRRHPYQIYEPNSKYGILKPWQIRANDYYPIGILREGKREDLINYLTNNLQIAKEKMDLMVRNAEYLNFDEIRNELNELKRKL